MSFCDQAGARESSIELFSEPTSTLLAILSASPDCVKLVEIDGTLSFMSRNGQCAMQVDDFALLEGCEWESCWPAETRPRIRAALAEAAAGHTDRFSAWYPTMKGAMRYWDVTVSPIIAEDGSIERFLSVSRDITPPKAAAPDGPSGNLSEPVTTGVSNLARKWQDDLQNADIRNVLDPIATAVRNYFDMRSVVIALAQDDDLICTAAKAAPSKPMLVSKAMALQALEGRTPTSAVEDVAHHPQYRGLEQSDNGETIAFFATAHIVNDDGARLGLLCVYDDKARPFTQRDATVLELFSGQIAAKLLKNQAAAGPGAVFSRELKHRLSNNYAQLTSLVGLTAASAETKEELARDLKERMAILSRTQVGILVGNYQSADIGSVIREVLGDTDDVTVNLDGHLVLNEQALFLLALCVSELVNNSRKYGALAAMEGDIDLSVSGDDLVTLRWTEELTSVEPPTGGFNSQILQRLVPRGLVGEATQTVDDKQFCYSLTVSRAKLDHGGQGAA
ncbi:PAS domain-containing protein [Parvularcula sp. LCG005]|uniref:PAS domain-containing protein n=1 Tax=Parvularcula sp. LCG005 TaxID=3078805 RepID=UPI002943AE66|nr:PAS domain-containing protein [Parvularcula sp. LCG005]WOI54453.1 PAS domain-containing protein [Parvularcula sp. LCG005]